MAKSDVIAQMAKEKSSKREAEVLAAISKMASKGQKISVYSVQKTTKASKSFLYGNKRIFNEIDKYRKFSNSATRKSDSKDAIIKAQHLQIEHLKKELSEVRVELGKNYKAKYEKILAENIELKEQLRVAYKY